MRTKPSRGSHLPILMKLFAMTKGPILELGSGMYSTPYLHWACFADKRPLVTYEDNPDWTDFAKQFQNDYHTVHVVTDWDAIDINKNWSIALVDHDPKTKRFRAQDASRLTDTLYVVCHDSNNAWDHKYKYSTLRFKYHRKFTEMGTPHTTVFSNKFELDNL